MEPTDLRLRKVDATNPAVWARITAMDAQCFADGSPAISDNSGAWWIARVRGLDAGYCGIRSSGYLCRAGVLPAYRGRGLQQQMIRRRIAYARARHWYFVYTDTNENLASANSLIACGFRLYEPDVKWSFDTALYWRKLL